MCIIYKVYTVDWEGNGQMIKFAICDDDEKFAHRFGAILIKEYNKNPLTGEDASYVYYADESEVMDNYRKDDIDIFVLDIEYGDVLGLDVARKLANRIENVGIVYITNHDQYVNQSFVCRPLGFIRKQYMESDLLPALLSMTEFLAKSKYQYVFHNGNEELKLPLSRVVRIEVFGHNMEVVTFNRTFNVRDNISRIEQDIVRRGFVKISRSCLVNLKHIETIDDCKITMTDNEAVHMSKERKSFVTDEWHRYQMTY